MKHLNIFCILFSMGSLLSFCSGQQTEQQTKKATTDVVGGPFENGEYIYNGLPTDLNATDTSAGWNLDGQKILITGIVYERDGETPAPGVLLYYYQTNTEGHYLHKPDEPRSMPPNKQGQTHGYIRGWVKTDAEGKYFIYTIKPGTYPTRDAPAHIHFTVKEPNDIKEYYIDDVVFDDDPLLNTEARAKLENRCGSGIVRLAAKESLQVGERNLILGLNIPNHPVPHLDEVYSGNNIGEDVYSFTPFHAWGPDKGTKTCPVCKYGWYNGILYFVGNDEPNWKELKQWLSFLEVESKQRSKYLKVYFVYGNAAGYDAAQREKTLANIGKELQLQKVALTFVPSFKDKESDIYLNKIDQQVSNTFIVYKRSRIIEKFMNLEPTAENFLLIQKTLDASVNEYFDLPSAGTKG